MKIGKLPVAASVFALVLALAGCGGSSPGAGPGPASGTARTTVGAITGFGSVFVNGVEFETPTNTRVKLDGVAGDSSALRVGMVVTVVGKIGDDGQTGVAESIEYDDELEGIVLSNDIPPGGSTGTLDVMGQQVTVTDTTAFESHVDGITSVDQITVGNVVEVSGYGDGGGSVEATRIEVKAADLATYLAGHEAIEVKGVVSEPHPDAFTFKLGDLTVYYAGAELDDLPPGGPEEGLFVEVKSVEGIDPVTGNLIASKVELADDDGHHGYEGHEGERTEIKGTVSRDYDGTTFDINGTTVLVDEDTRFVGLNADELLVGRRVKAEGNFNADGQLVAEIVKAQDEHEEETDEIEGIVAGVTVAGEMSGTITMADGKVIVVNTETVMEDDRDDGMTPDPQFNLSDLENGDYIEAVVYPDPDMDNRWIATKITREDQHPGD